MNQVTPEQKTATTKALAIVGFLALIVLIVFVIVKLVSFLPSAWGSLASIADSVYNYQEEPTLTVATKSSVVNADTAFTINWDAQKQAGTFAFSYACTDGTAMDIRKENGDVEALNCNTSLPLGNATSLDVIVHTEKQRFTDVNYTITFTPENTSSDSYSASSEITIVNVGIPTSATIGTPAPTSTPSTTVTETKPTTPPPPRYVTHVTYTTPHSDPNGFTDLAVTFLGVGTLEHGILQPRPELRVDEAGAIQFAVKNIGTKTSTEWTYVVDLPSGGTYTSKIQQPLKPNETATLTLTFHGVRHPGVTAFGANVDVPQDNNRNNNHFTWAVNVR